MTTAQSNATEMRPFHLTSGDAGNAESDGTASAWSDIWKYTVPRGTEIILSNGSIFSCYLEDTAPAEIGDRDNKLKIEVRDPAESAVELVYGPNPYVRSKEFQDDDSKARLRLSQPISVPARYLIVISAYDGVSIDASDSYYDLLVQRIQRSVGR